MQNNEPIIFEESATNPVGLTPFGFYDADITFQEDAPKVATFVARRLGYPVVDVELTHRQIYAAFEESITTYSNQVNQFNAREHMLAVQGMSTSIDLTQKNIISTPLPQLVKLSAQYGTEAQSGGNTTMKKLAIQAAPGQQEYDVADFLPPEDAGKIVEIRKVFHNMPPAIARYYDPFATSGLGLTNLMGEFGFDGYSPPVTFVMMPAYEDLLRIQAIEINDMIRKSQYSFSIANNKIRFTPLFKKDTTVWVDYYVVDEKLGGSFGDGFGGAIQSGSRISDLSNIPYTNILYENINSIGRLWIYKYTLATAKELLGNIRAKYMEIPIPDSSIRMDGETLRREGQEEKRQLIEELRETLEQTGYTAQIQKQVENANAMNQIFKFVPIPIWIG
jgi:hypothetical protein